MNEQEKILEVIETFFDLRPAAIIKNFGLRRPIYAQTSSYGHMGREDLNLPWEDTSIAEKIRAYIQ